MKARAFWGVAGFVVGVAVAGAQDAPVAPPPAAGAPPAEVVAPTYLYEVLRHLYRWYLDESDVERRPDGAEFSMWVRRLDVPLDPGDRSEYAEIGLPGLGLAVKVKKANYASEELGAQVASRGFRIVNVARVELPTAAPLGSAVVPVPMAEMRDYLFRTRNESTYPDAALLERLRVALRLQLGLDPEKREAGEQVVHVAPLSPVANELWVFWENRKMLIRFAADFDLDNPAMWEHQALAIRTYDVETQTVVSLHEAPGSNEFLTRDQVGRALYNCVILGRRLATANPDE